MRVSVIVPSLNAASYIKQCLESITGQTLNDIEIICVDAGSTDGTLDIIEKFQAEDGRVRLIRSPRKSYGYQMNLGIESATGDYIGIVESDDFVPRNMYEDLYTTAIQQNAEIVKADFYRFISKGDGYERTYNALDPSRSYYGRVINPEEEQEVFRFVMNTWSGIYSRAFLEANKIRHNESPGASYQDTGFWFQTLCCARRVYFIDRPYYMNRRDNEGSSVYDPGKVYSMSEEWHFIYSWLKKDAGRFDIFKGVYALKFYHSLLFTYQRIAPEYREEFILHMGDEMAALYDNGEYDRRSFTTYEWKRFRLIAAQPLCYHEICLNRCSHLLVMYVLKKIGPHYRIASVIRKADNLSNKIEILLSWIGHEGIVKALRRAYYKNKKDYVGKDVMNGCCFCHSPRL